MSAVLSEGVQVLTQRAHFNALPSQELLLTCRPLPVKAG